MACCVEAFLPSEHDILSSREAQSKLAITERHLKAQGPLTIVENFNVIYSCLFHIKTLKQETIDEILSMLIKGLNLLEIDLKRALADKMTNDVRIKYLNSLKMLMYLTIEFTNYVEKSQLAPKDGDFGMIGAKKGTKRPQAGASAASEGASTFDWNDTKEKILDAIAKIVLLNIQKLWDPPIAEEQFVIMITNLCYKLMENFGSGSVRLQQKKVLKDHLCHILGLMIKKYNHSYGACVMIMQTLPHYEHLGALYADLIQTCVVQLGYESILPDILREFRHTSQTHQPTSTASNQNDPNFKFYSQFIIDLSDRLAPHLLPYLSLIQDLLDDDSYMMRNAILHLYGEIIVKVLNQEATDNDLKLKQMRNELLDTLCEHIHDTNAITRSRTLQIWRRICEEKAMPLHYMNEVMKRCIGRMEDVASSVRKSAFQLLCDLIRKNPYGIRSIEMSLEQIEQECVKEEAALQKLKDEDEKLIEQFNKDLEDHHNEINSQAGSKDSDMENNNEDDGESQDETNGTKKGGAQQQQNDLQDQQEREKRQQLIIVQTSKVNYLKDMLSFVKQLEAAIPKISRLLFSKIQTDVLEVISFFVTCYEHGLNDMLIGIRKMLSLVMFAEKSIKDAVINAYKRLYLTNNNEASESSLASAVQIAKQLIKLIQGITICERDALEELIGEFALSGELDNSVIQVLWEIFANFEQNASNRLNALILLGMVIKRIPEKGRANIQVLIDYGLNSKPPVDTSSNENNNMEMDVEQTVDPKASVSDLDLMIFSETCLALSFISPDTNTKKLTQQDVNTKADAFGKKDKKAKEDANAKKQTQLQFNNEPFKLINTHQLFERLNVLLVDQFAASKTNHWIPFAENGLQCIFKLADNPILISESITIKLIDKIPPLKALLYKQLPQPVSTQSDEMLSSQLPPSTQLMDESSFRINTKLFCRFFSFIGLLSTKLLIFLNQYVVCELKRRKMCKENQQLNENDSHMSKNKSSNASSASSKSKRRQSMKLLKSFNQQGDMGLEEEMGLQGAEAEDVELILIESIIDQKIIVSSPGNVSILAQLLPIIVAILKDPSRYNDDTLQLACALALVKLMVLSQKLCTQYSQLLFTLMEKSTNSLIRSQLILGIGDLVYRFPNAMEPWTNHLYLPLRDKKSKQVRMNTIRVLSHLILKEMIKTRGQLYEIALCTVDQDPQISAMSKQFFQELSARNNGLVIYNAMPDMISNLSGGANGNEKSLNEQGITEEAFRNIVTYLFTFIKRDKQCETLIEKLCHAFRQANKSERKCRDLAFCLSKLQLSENGIKKLKETFKWYADKLCIPYVYETFKNTILKNARKLVNIKNETKLLIDELEKQIEEVRQKGLEKENGDSQEETETGAAEPEAGQKNKDTKDDENDDSSSSEAEEEVEQPLNQRARRGNQPPPPLAANNKKQQESSKKVDMLSKFNRETTSQSTAKGGRASARGKQQQQQQRTQRAPSPPSRTASRRKVVVKEEESSEEDSDDEEDDEPAGRMSNSSTSSSSDSE